MTREEHFAGEPALEDEPVVRVRSTLLSASVLVLRERAMWDQYWAQLGDEDRPKIDGLVAGTWLPIELAVAHYRACDRIGLDPRQVSDNGLAVGRRIQGTMLQTAVRLATGSNPWVGLSLFPRLWKRVFIGGSVAIWKIGPKDARVEVSAMPLSEIPYFRHSYQGLVLEAFGLFATHVYLREVPTRARGRVILKAAWT